MRLTDQTASSRLWIGLLVGVVAVLFGGLTAMTGWLALAALALLLVTLAVGARPAMAIGLAIPLYFNFFGLVDRNRMLLSMGFQLRDIAFMLIMAAAGLTWIGHSRTRKDTPYFAFAYPVLAIVGYVVARVVFTWLEGWSLWQSFRMSRSYLTFLLYFAVVLLIPRAHQVRTVVNLAVLWGVMGAIIEIWFQLSPTMVFSMLSRANAAIQRNYGGVYLSKLYMPGSHFICWVFFLVFFRYMQRGSRRDLALTLITLAGSIATMWRTVWISLLLALLLTLGLTLWSDVARYARRRALAFGLILVLATVLFPVARPTVARDALAYLQAIPAEIISGGLNYGARLSVYGDLRSMSIKEWIMGAGFVNISDTTQDIVYRASADAGYFSLVVLGGLVLLGVIAWLLMAFIAKAISALRAVPQAEYAWLWRATLAFVFYVTISNYTLAPLIGDEGILPLALGIGLCDVISHLRHSPAAISSMPSGSSG